MPIQKIPKEDVLGVIEKLGPCQPIDIRKALKQGDSFLIGAMLSEFVAEGKLAITKVRRGGSPFYYDVQKPQTLDMVSQYLNEKDRRTYALLKEHLVLREDIQEPLVRVGLQNMSDFSYPIDIDGIRYWKYFLIDDDGARKVVKANGIDKQSEPIDEPDDVPEEVVEKKEIPSKRFDESAEASDAEPKIEQPVTVQKTPVPAASSKDSAPKKKGRKKKTEEHIQDPVVQKEDSSAQQQQIQQSSAQHEESAAPDAAIQDSSSDASSQSASAVSAVTKVPAASSDAAPKKKRSAKKSKTMPAPTVTSDGSVVITPEAWLAHDTLYERILVFAGGAALKEQKVIKPNAQLSCVMAIDLPYGKLDMMIMAFNRKFTDEDLAKAVASAKDKGLPILLLSVDPFPSKMTSVFKGFSNVMFKQFEQKQK